MMPITAGALLPLQFSLQEKTLRVCVPYSFRTAVRDLLRPLLIDLEGSLPHDPIIRTWKQKS